MANAATVAAMVTASTEGTYAEDNFSATSALVSFLRMEADLAEEKAKRLRAQATTLAKKFGVSDAIQDAYELDPDELPPLDEHGIPKYKGKKRGRKPKNRKRKANPNRRKRQHTAYTLFVKETYPGIKAANPTFASKDIIAIVAKQWGQELSPQEKEEWKARAVATHDVGESPGAGQTIDGIDDEEAVAAAAAAAAAVEDVEEDEEVDEQDEEEVRGIQEEEAAPPARRSRRKKA